MTRHRLPRPLWLALFLCLLSCGPVLAQTLTVAGFNVESGAANPNTIEEQIAPLDDIDLWGFSEVRNASDAAILEDGAADGEGATFERILGSTGSEDRLLIVYNSDRLQLLAQGEIDELNIGGRVRAPLWARFQLKPSGPEFIFMVNHLYRGNTAGRHAQARGLNDWAEAQTVPVIATGDYNFDWHFQNGDTDHDDGYDLMTDGGVFEWVRPAALIPTNCSAHQSVLDFVFVAGAARNWNGVGEILFDQASYCPDDNSTSDHRPVLARFDLSGAGGGGGGGQTTCALTAAQKNQLLQRVEELEEQMRGLRELIESLGGQ